MDAVDVCIVSALLASLGVFLYLNACRKPKIHRRYWVRPWIRRRELSCHQNMIHLYRELLSDGDVAEFRATLRMDPEVYANLLKILTPGLQKKSSNFRNPISAETRLIATMRYLALGEGFRSISQQFRVGLSTARVMVRETCQAIIRILQHDYLKTPTTKQEWMKISTEFNNRWHFPHCLGCLDGKHIWIIAPRKSGTFFYNYKDFFSIVLLAIASADYKFLYIDVGAEGKSSDGGIWAKCRFQEYLQDPENPLGIPDPTPLGNSTGNIPFMFLGDDAFRLSPSLMKPYAGTGLSMKQQIYNYRLSRARRIIENVFGILACRFRIFHRTIEVNPDYVEDVVMAACILHNYLRVHARTDYIPTIAVDHELEDGTHVAGAWRQEVNLEPMTRSSQRNASQYAKQIRNDIADYFLTEEGEIDWQYDRGLL